MPILNWIGKDAVINHHHDVPYRTLDKKYTFANGKCVEAADNVSADDENKIIHGDNLEALKALLPEYEGRVKCIYIDPPYNTGNEKWVYNDNVNSPKIQKWLHDVYHDSGITVDDLSRHDKWLCMMYPRLVLLKKLLANDGAIFISIDDNEQANLKLICDEIFGAGNFVGIFSWVRKKKGSFLSKTLRKMIEYVYCYKSSNSDIEFYGENAYSEKWQPIVKRTNQQKQLIIPSNLIETTLPDGLYDAGFRGKEGTGVEFVNSFTVKNGIVITDVTVLGRFVWTQDFLDNELKNGTKISLSNKFGFNVLRFNQESKTKTPSTLINDQNGVGTNEDASFDLQKIFKSGVNEVFQYSKPHSLIEYLINMLCKEDLYAIILDSFAGSGTTAHAVLNLNKQDGGNRKFILVEMEDYAENITAERVRRVIKGYGEGKNAKEGTGGSFTFYELGEPIFKEDGYLNESVGTEKLCEYIWYTETRKPYSRQTEGNLASKGYLLGTHNDTAYYFYYEPNKATTLDKAFLNTITVKADMYIIYADNCLLNDEFMHLNNIKFKKIPRDIKKI